MPEYQFVLTVSTRDDVCPDAGLIALGQMSVIADEVARSHDGAGLTYHFGEAPTPTEISFKGIHSGNDHRILKRIRGLREQ